MNYSTLLVALVTVLGLSACDKPTTVNVPAPPAAAPGPAGPQGKAGTPGMSGTHGTPGMSGTQGTPGMQGETGKTGGDTIVVVPPPAPASQQ